MREIFTCWVSDPETNSNAEGNPATISTRGAALIKDGDVLQLHLWHGAATITVSLSPDDVESLIEALTVESA